MARVQWLVVVSAWLLVGTRVVHARIRHLPHRHWMAAIETLRGWVPAPEREQQP